MIANKYTQMHTHAQINSRAVTYLVASVVAEIVQEGLSSSEQKQQDVVYQDDCLNDVVSQLLIRSGKDVQGQNQANEQHWDKLRKRIGQRLMQTALSTIYIIFL